MVDTDPTAGRLKVGDTEYRIADLAALAESHPEVRALPFSLKILLENALRQRTVSAEADAHVETLIAWDPRRPCNAEIGFHPVRVLLQDFTGVPALVDLAAMRDAMVRMGGKAATVNPTLQVDLVVDHSVQVDRHGSVDALAHNASRELERNGERYAFLRWGQQAFDGLRVVPPARGIVHQVNLEYLATVVAHDEGPQVMPDTLVGTDSHTTMVNALGVLAWGVGGIEAEAAMLGQAIPLVVPEVVGVRLEGAIQRDVTATDVVLAITQILRRHGVVGKFVEFFGPGLASLPLAHRATIANMAPEYGATVGFFPVDPATLKYLRLSNRSTQQVHLVEAYCRRQGLFYTDDTHQACYSNELCVDLGEVEPALAGPRRPQDRIGLRAVKQEALNAAREMVGRDPGEAHPLTLAGTSHSLGHGAVVIAAITSCTNTSNPSVMLGAGLLARNAVAKGLRTRPWVKTSLAPGSKVVADYLKEAELYPALEALGFHLVGYGCTTCIGNSGPVLPEVAAWIREYDMVAASVLSGNRNFEGRINPLVRMNFLASPMFVVAYALVGRMGVDLTSEPLGTDAEGEPVYLRDIWPSDRDIADLAATVVKTSQFAMNYEGIFSGESAWQSLSTAQGDCFPWDPRSSYVREPPFLADIPAEPPPLTDIVGARVLAKLGDSVTTDHISPAGSIPPESPAGEYLAACGVAPEDFNSYGSRRGNHDVMVRATFANIRLRNALVPGVEGGITVHVPSNTQMTIYEAACRYQQEGTPTVVLAGAEYGTGSSRDWAAKGPQLLGVRAVLAKSFERIHRTNLVGMGVLPLQFNAGEDAESLGLVGHELLTIEGIAADLTPRRKILVRAVGQNQKETLFSVVARIDSLTELAYLRHGGILPFVLRQLLSECSPGS